MKRLTNKFLKIYLKPLAILMALLFLIIPGRLGWLDGLPLGQFHELFFLVILASLFIFLPINWKRLNTPQSRQAYLVIIVLLAFLLLGKYLISSFSLQKGLIASYYFSSLENGTSERSTEFINSGINGTRIDTEINFRSIGFSLHEKPFALWFLNDSVRFNDIDTEKKQHQLFTAIWEGYLYIPTNRNSIFVENDGTAILYLDNEKVFDSTEITMSEVQLDTYSKAVLPFKLIYKAADYKDADTLGRFLKISWESHKEAESVKSFFLKPHSPLKIYLDKLLAALDILLKIIFISVVIWLFSLLIRPFYWNIYFQSWRPYLLLAAVFIFRSLLGRLFDFASFRGFNFLTTGDDPHHYETMARHIQFTGDWAIRTFEKGSYYVQILSYYSLTLAHYLFGEALFPITFIQLLSVLLTALIIFWIGYFLLRSKLAIDDFLFLFLVFITVSSYPVIVRQSFYLFPIGTFLISLAIVFLFLSEKYFWQKKSKKLLFFPAGIIFGLAVLMRANFLICLPLFGIWFLLSFGRRFFWPSALYLTGFVLVLMPFVWRNAVVAGEWRLMSRVSTTNNFMQSAPIPIDYVPSGKDYSTIFKRLDSVFDNRAHPHLQWVFDEPGAFVKHWGVKMKSLEGGFLLLFYVFIAVSILFLWKPKFFSENINRKDYLVTGGFVLLQIFSLLVLAKNETRYYLPIYPLLIIFSYLPFLPIIRVCRKFLFRKYQDYCRTVPLSDATHQL